MGKLAAFLMTTLDGYVEGPDGGFDHWNLDAEFDRFSVDQLDRAGALAFGRVTYRAMAAYWQSAAAIERDPEVAARMNALPKIVLSATLGGADWTPTTILTDAVGLTRARSEYRGDLLILGSNRLTASLAAGGLLDELRIMVNPVALGAGRPLLNALDAAVSFDLRSVDRFQSGNVLLTYANPRSQRR